MNLDKFIEFMELTLFPDQLEALKECKTADDLSQWKISFTK